MAEKDEQSTREGRDLYTIPRLKTMRLLNGLSMSKLAQLAGVDRDTIKKIEKNLGVADYIAAKVHAAACANLLPEYKNPDEIKKATQPGRPELKAVPR